jgi:hypothetical protein
MLCVNGLRLLDLINDDRGLACSDDVDVNAMNLALHCDELVDMGEFIK